MKHTVLLFAGPDIGGHVQIATSWTPQEVYDAVEKARDADVDLQLPGVDGSDSFVSKKMLGALVAIWANNPIAIPMMQGQRFS